MRQLQPESAFFGVGDDNRARHQILIFAHDRIDSGHRVLNIGTGFAVKVGEVVQFENITGGDVVFQILKLDRADGNLGNQTVDIFPGNAFGFVRRRHRFGNFVF